MDYRSPILQFEGRISSLEAKVQQDKETLDDHETLIRKLDTTLSTVVSQVSQIRNALYVLAFVVSCNIPAVQSVSAGFSEAVKHFILP